jgi:hypothetical protein
MRGVPVTSRGSLLRRNEMGMTVFRARGKRDTQGTRVEKHQIYRQRIRLHLPQAHSSHLHYSQLILILRNQLNRLHPHLQATVSSVPPVRCSPTKHLQIKSQNYQCHLYQLPILLLASGEITPNAFQSSSGDSNPRSRPWNRMMIGRDR